MSEKTPIALKSYETFGEDYAKAIEDNAYNAHFERPSTLALLPDLNGKKVLDAGCGPGLYTDLLTKQGAKVTGIDVSPSMIQLAKIKLQDKAEFFLQDLSRPLEVFRDKTFDFVLSSLTVHYIEDHKALFSEFHRVLKADGQLVFSTHHPFMDFADSPSKNYFKKELLIQTWNTTGKPVQVQFYRRPLSELTSAITATGFIIEEMNEGVLTERLRERYPKHYEKLSTQPQFLFFRLRKL